MVEVGTGGAKSRFLKTDWPFTEGLTAGTTKTHDRKTRLEPEEASLIRKKDREGI